MVHWAGPPDQAHKALQPFCDVAPIVANGTSPLPYPALNAAFDGLYPKGIRDLRPFAASLSKALRRAGGDLRHWPATASRRSLRAQGSGEPSGVSDGSRLEEAVVMLPNISHDGKTTGIWNKPVSESDQARNRPSSGPPTVTADEKKVR